LYEGPVESTLLHETSSRSASFLSQVLTVSALLHFCSVQALWESTLLLEGPVESTLLHETSSRSASFLSQIFESQ